MYTPWAERGRLYRTTVANTESRKGLLLKTRHFHFYGMNNNTYINAVNNWPAPILRQLSGSATDPDLRPILLTTRKAASYIILVAYVCLSVYLSVCNAITYERLDVGSSFLVFRCILMGYRSSSYMKVVESSSRSQEQKNRKSLSLQCKTSIRHRPSSVSITYIQP